ncbi:hypothetical protein ACIOAU_19125 [Pseudomonas sp. NPDC088322]|uniref:hypothetical protein n=1 Tax=Pseudomonas sp. NPDC088322 TaxID=3364452 RepID=UPI003825080D
MSIIKRPPEVITDPLGLISAQHQDQAAQYFALAHPLDPKGSYCTLTSSGFGFLLGWMPHWLGPS